jgi:23S rRNA pseudouridine1911/1915/1917 synthase
MEELFEHHRIVVDKGQQVMRIDKYLVNRMMNTSRSKIQAAAEAGNILVNERAVKSNYKIKPEEVISIVLPHPPRDTEILPEDIPLDVIFEDEHILVINKNARGYEARTGAQAR